MMRNRIHVVTVLFVLAAAAAVAQEKGEPMCGDCHNTGRVPHEHDPKLLDLEQDALYCSVFIESDPEALGLDWVPCPKCKSPSLKAAAEAEFEKLLAPRRAWLAERQHTVDDLVKAKVDHIETEHFILAFDLPKVVVGRTVYRRHEAMHLYARRLEALYHQILDLHGMTEADTNGVKHHIYMFERQKVAMIAAPHFTGQALRSGAKVSLLGPESHMVSWDDPGVIGDDSERYQFLTHAVSHHIHDAIQGRKYWLFERYGWVYEGLAHWVEIKNFGSPVTWCTAEAGMFAHWKSPSWEANVKRAVMAGEEVKFQEIIGKGAGALSAEEHQYAWSYIDYLMHLDPKKIYPMLQMMTGPQAPERDCLRDVYGLTIGQYVDGWREYVLKEYSLKPWKGPVTRSKKGKG